VSPKLRAPQPKRRRPLPDVSIGVELPPEGLFWVRVTVPENCAGLRPGLNLMLHASDDKVSVLNGVAPLGELQPKGVAWVRTHGYSSCVFVKYGTDPNKRFQVKIAAR